MHLPVLLWLFLLISRVNTTSNTTDSSQNFRYNYGSEQDIWENVVKNQLTNVEVRPVKNQNDTVFVEIAPILTAVVSLDEVDERVTLSLTFGMRWKNQFISWDPTGAVAFITIPCGYLWMPRVTMETTLELSEIPDWERQQCRVEHDGDIALLLNQIQTSICQLDVFKFPFDSQTCRLLYTAWMYPDSRVSLIPMDKWKGHKIEIRSPLLQDIPEWKIDQYVANEFHTESPNGEPVTYISYDLTLQRKSVHYIINIILPSFIICTLSILGLFSPSEGTGQVRNEKIQMGLTCLLTMSVMLLVVSGDLPKTNMGSLLDSTTTKLVYLNKLLSQDKPLPGWVNLLACSGKVEDENAEITEHETVRKSIINRYFPFFQNFTLLRNMLGSVNVGENYFNYVMKSEDGDEAAKIALIYKHKSLEMLLDQCLKHVVYIRQLTEQAKMDADELLMRSEGLCRLEHTLLIFFLVLNVTVTVVWFIVGMAL